MNNTEKTPLLSGLVLTLGIFLAKAVEIGIGIVFFRFCEWIEQFKDRNYVHSTSNRLNLNNVPHFHDRSSFI